MNYKILSLFAVAAAVALSCSKEDDTEQKTNKHQYNFTSKDPVKMDVSISKNDSYEVKELKLDGSALAAAFQGSIPDDLNFYAINSDGSKIVGEDEYTSEFGFYFDSTGTVCMPSAAGCSFFVEYYGNSENNGSYYIGIGQYPGACEAGDTLTLKIGLADSITGQPFELKITVKAPGDWAAWFENADHLTYTVYETVNTDYKALEVFINETALCQALGAPSAASVAAGVSAKTIAFQGLNADGSVYASGYTANNFGYWFDAAGNVCSWKAAGCSVYSEWYGNTPISFNIGQFPSGIVAGDKFTIRQAFVVGAKKVILTFRIRIVEEVTDEMGPDETGE
jgi:hypothetical protein